MFDPSDPRTDRSLVLLRHAKAAQSDGGPDLGRPLTDRGQRDAAAVGRWLGERGIVADVVLCSAAVRCRETWQYAEAGGARGGDVWFDSRIYDADPDALLEVIHEVPEPAVTVVLVGHGPGVPWLAHDLAAADSSGRDELTLRFPTSGLVVLRHTCAWRALAAGDAVLTDFVVPRG